MYVSHEIQRKTYIFSSHFLCLWLHSFPSTHTHTHLRNKNKNVNKKNDAYLGNGKRHQRKHDSPNSIGDYGVEEWRDGGKLIYFHTIIIMIPFALWGTLNIDSEQTKRIFRPENWYTSTNISNEYRLQRRFWWSVERPATNSQSIRSIPKRCYERHHIDQINRNVSAPVRCNITRIHFIRAPHIQMKTTNVFKWMELKFLGNDFPFFFRIHGWWQRVDHKC